MKIGEASKLTGLSTHTIRYYEKLGLLSATTKDNSGHRYYTPQDIELIDWIACLKKSGMSLKSIERYVVAFNKGHDSVMADILKTHLEKLEAQQYDIQHYIDVTQKKIHRLTST